MVAGLQPHYAVSGGAPAPAPSALGGAVLPLVPPVSPVAAPSAGGLPASVVSAFTPAPASSFRRTTWCRGVLRPLPLVLSRLLFPVLLRWLRPLRLPLCLLLLVLLPPVGCPLGRKTPLSPPSSATPPTSTAATRSIALRLRQLRLLWLLWCLRHRAPLSPRSCRSRSGCLSPVVLLRRPTATSGSSAVTATGPSPRTDGPPRASRSTSRTPRPERRPYAPGLRGCSVSGAFFFFWCFFRH